MFKKFVGIGALVGLLVPGLVLLKFSMTNELAGMFEFLLWPSSIFLMANEQYSDGDPQIWVNVAISVLVNVVWYIVLASFAYAIRRTVGAAQKRFRDG